MKVDGLGVVLAIILLPIILVVSYYIRLQVDTIGKENEYNTKLLAATYDAMSAFESNTANEELSSVADSMRSLILASNNVLLDSLATNLGITNASREHLQPYIPAVLYTLYDGYYIYSPTQIPKVAEKKEEKLIDPSNPNSEKIITTKGYLSVGEEGVKKSGENYTYDNTSNEKEIDEKYGEVLFYKKDTNNPQNWDGANYTTNKEQAVEETDYVLKSYVQYSARYTYPNSVNPTIDVTINYTLDNYLNIIGKIGDVFYTKTGYLIDRGLVTAVNINGTPYSLTDNNEDDAKDKILGKKTNAPTTTKDVADEISIVVGGVTIDAKWENIKGALGNLGYYEDATQTNTGYANIRTISEAESYLKKAYEEKEETNLSDIQNLEYEIGKYKAITYYVSSSIFSNWVYENLGDLTYGNIQDNAMTAYYGDPNDPNSNINYTATSGTGNDDLYYNFDDPAVSGRTIFTDSDPEATDSAFNTHKMEVIKNSIKYNLNLAMSAYSKMEHPYDCSLPILLDEEWDKILNNISIVSFMQGFDCGLDIYNNYEIASSTNNELMVTPSEIYYVKKGEFNNEDGNYHRIDCPYLIEEDDTDEYISFKSKEVKYDKVPSTTSGEYQYDHKNLSCYTCINTNNYYERSLFDFNLSSYYERINSLEKSENDSSTSVAKKKAGYIGIAKERQNTYKTNALLASEGYKVFPSQQPSVNGKISNVSLENFGNMKELQITIKVTKNEPSTGSQLQTLKLKIKSTGTGETTEDITLIQPQEQTKTIDVSNWTGNTISIEPNETLPVGYQLQYNVESIKAIYK